MADIERSDGEDDLNRNIVEIMARYKLGQIKREDMSEDNQVILKSYLELMDDDPEFRQKVISRKNEISEIATKGVKTPLYTDEELAKAKRHRKKKPTSYEHAYQPGLFGEPDQEREIIGFDDILDPEKKLGKLHQELQGRFSSGNSRLIKKEVQQKRMELREILGIPVARGKNKHVRDPFYQMIVRKFITFDNFGVGHEFDRVLTEMPPELETKINQIKKALTEILDDNLNLRQKYQKLHQFEDDFKNDWGK